ncbi:LysR family transcriptional regulator [Oceanospirillum sediminis]|uniref:LysR family transcriptional regulator n=1 Tax=Oceanospirillum sediminis TaxID=2760088 RepID=A0A839IPY3_9GAMM|nr:LysR family transcriptional regulator [Oceanospirillum sediminis]MBB1486507.1 LysR family transcriptional regulator [Oceanospirillum sediminis]
MDIRQLKYFIAVAEELSFRRAAERLYITQPPLSQQIRQLEEELDTQLLIRNTRQVSLTPAGEYFLGKARNIIRDTDQARYEVRDLGKQQQQKIRIGYSGTSTFVAPVMQRLKEYAAQQSGVSLHMVCGNATELQQKLLSDQLDLALIRNSQPPASPDLLYHHISEEQLYVLALADHPLMQQTIVHPRQLESCALVTYSRTDNTSLRLRIDHYLKENHCSPGNIIEVSDISAMINMVQFGLGVAILPESVARSFSEQFAARPASGRENSIGLYLCMSGQSSDIARHLFDKLQ